MRRSLLNHFLQPNYIKYRQSNRVLQVLTWAADEHEEDLPPPLKTQQQARPHMHQRVQLPRQIAEDDRSELRSGYRAIKRTVIPLPDATKHVTILLGPRRSEPCQNMTEDRTFFSPGECFNYRVACSRNASAQMSVRSSPLCAEDSFCNTRKRGRGRKNK